MSPGLAKTAEQFEQVMERLLASTNKLVTDYQALVAREQFDANRIVTLSDIAPGAATGTIDLSRKLGQLVVIEGIYFVLPTAAIPTLQLGRDTIQYPAVPTQMPIAPVKYFLGQADTIKLTWTGASGTTNGYLLLFGKLTGNNWQ